LNDIREAISTEIDELAAADAKPNIHTNEDERPAPTKSRKQLAAETDAATRLRTERKKRKRLQEMRVAKLDALRKRQREIMAAADQLDLQRAKLAHTVGGVNKNGVKFKVRERKR
jgi:U3 small nucleolar RNA-associated protein 11